MGETGAHHSPAPDAGGDIKLLKPTGPRRGRSSPKRPRPPALLPPRTRGKPRTAREPNGAQAILSEANTTLLDLSVEAARAAWVYETNITPDTESLTARADSRVTQTTLGLAKRAAQVSEAGLPEAEARQLRLLRLSLPLFAPSDPKESEELARLVASMRGRYGKGRHRPRGAAEPLNLNALSRRLAESRDPAELEDVWTGWHAVGRPMRSE
ncbi:MAG TPA: M2 family metallopeptidase, partial [Thermoplasmata archaeon]|nr:M2 family metallopeptidase [Thermoplasmata archaeon]